MIVQISHKPIDLQRSIIVLVLKKKSVSVLSTTENNCHLRVCMEVSSFFSGAQICFEVYDIALSSFFFSFTH